MAYIFRAVTVLLTISTVTCQSWRTFQDKHVVQAARPRNSDDCYRLVRAQYARRPTNSLIFATPAQVLQDFGLRQRGDQQSGNGRTICTVRNGHNGRSAELCDGSKYTVTIDNDGGQYRPVHYAGNDRGGCRRLS